MYNKNKDLASLLSSRLCHDLANPLGAIQNGLELMELSGAHRTPEFELTAASVQNANAKLNFYRTAFTPTKTGDVSPQEVIKTLADVYLNTRCQIQYNITQDISREHAKALFLLVLCLESGLPRGGEVTISNDQTVFLLAAEGINLSCENGNWDHLLGHKENPDLAPSEIHFELARIALLEASKEIDFTLTDARVEIRI